jgi:hypothetical protein
LRKCSQPVGAKPPANGGQERDYVSRQAWTGWVACPGSFFFGTVVPASQLPTRNHILRNASARNNGSQGMIFRYRGISTPSKSQPFFSTGRFPARCHPDRGRSSAMLTADFQGADASGGVKTRTLCQRRKECGTRKFKFKETQIKGWPTRRSMVKFLLNTKSPTESRGRGG